MTLSAEERDARRTKSQAIVDASREKKRQEDIAVISNILRQQAPIPDAHLLATLVVDGLHAQKRFIIHFDTESGGDSA